MLRSEPRLRVSLVIPAYQEYESLQLILPRIHAVTRDHDNYDFEVMVVTEMRTSQDTRALIESFGATVVDRGPSDSFGDAIRSGIAASSEDSTFLVFMDADGSHPPETVPRLLAQADTADVVVASRYIPGGSTDNSALLRFMSRLLNKTYALVLGIKCHDVSTNFKLYRTQSLKALTLTCTNFDIVEEILVRLLQANGKERLHIVEVPDHFAERNSGESKRRLSVFIASYIWTLLRLRFSRSPQV